MPRKMPRRTCGYPGCTKKCRGPRNKFCSVAHVPKSTRQDNCRRGRATFAYKMRMKRFEREIRLLQGRTITREELLASYQRIHRTSYVAGFKCGDFNGFERGFRDGQQAAQKRTAA